MLPNGGVEGHAGSDDDDWDDYEEDNPITDDQKAFAKEFLGFFQSLIDREEESMADVGEEFVSERSLDDHFAKHCIGNSDRKSTKRDILYDFTTKKQYSNYEGRLQKSFREGPVDSLDSVFDVDDINEKFHRLFEGDKYILIGAIFGLENSQGPVSLGIHSFSSDVTTNYIGGNTVDLCVMSASLRTITLYALDVQLLKSKLLSIFGRYLKRGNFMPSHDNGKLLDAFDEGHALPSASTKEAKMTEYDKKIVNSVKSNGVYSLKKGWLKHPERKDIPNVDMDAFDRLFAGWKARYDGLTGKVDSSDDVTEFIEDLYDLRRKSIAKEGEYGLGNLVFKEFRGRGYLDRLRELRNELKSRELSLEGMGHATGRG